jgi:tRNA(Leu) C34 or U34 (ribose-2'-O)-methylase TrmL
MHLALMEPTDAKATSQVASLCADSGTSLHIIGPTDLPMTALEGKEAEGKLDLWIHPDWFEFRRAIARERCYYFSPDGGKAIEEARLRPTSVLMFSGDGDLPARIKEKYPTRIYKLPASGVAGVKAVLEAAMARVGARGSAPEGGKEAAKPRGRPRRSR